MAVEIRELYHFAIDASSVNADEAAFVQEIRLFELTGFNGFNVVQTSRAYVQEFEPFVLEGKNPVRISVTSQQWYMLSGPNKAAGVTLSKLSGLFQVEGCAADTAMVVTTHLFQITS